MKRGNEQGSALVLAMMVTMILVVVGGALGVYGIVEKSEVQKEDYEMLAFFIARSGADAVAQGIIDNPQTLETVLGQTFEPVQLGEGSFTVQVIRDEIEPNKIHIISTGEVQNKRRTLSLDLIIPEQPSLVPNFEHAVFVMGNESKGDLKLLGSASILGAVATNLTAPGSIEFGWSAHMGGPLFLGPGADSSKVFTIPAHSNIESFVSGGLANIRTLPVPMVHAAPDFPDFPAVSATAPTFSISSGGPVEILPAGNEYKKIGIAGNRTVQIDVPEGTRKIYVRDFNITQGTILLDGPGRLEIYVENEFTMGGSSHVNYLDNGVNDPKRLTIYYAGSKNLDQLGGNTRLAGNIFLKTGGMSVLGSSVIEGYVFSSGNKMISVAGSGKFAQGGLIYAPNAPVKVGGSGVVGAIVSKTLEITGSGGTIEYSNLLLERFPSWAFTSATDDPQSNIIIRGDWSETRS